MLQRVQSLGIAIWSRQWSSASPKGWMDGCLWMLHFGTSLWPKQVYMAMGKQAMGWARQNCLACWGIASGMEGKIISQSASGSSLTLDPTGHPAKVGPRIDLKQAAGYWEYRLDCYRHCGGHASHCLWWIIYQRDLSQYLLSCLYSGVFEGMWASSGHQKHALLQMPTGVNS